MAVASLWHVPSCAAVFLALKSPRTLLCAFSWASLHCLQLTAEAKASVITPVRYTSRQPIRDGIWVSFACGEQYRVSVSISEAWGNLILSYIHRYSRTHEHRRTDTQPYWKSYMHSYNQSHAVLRRLRFQHGHEDFFRHQKIENYAKASAMKYITTYICSHLNLLSSLSHFIYPNTVKP